MNQRSLLSRRQFLALSAVSAAGLVTPGRAHARVLGANETIRVGVIGLGARGAVLLEDLLKRSRTGNAGIPAGSSRGDAVCVAAVCDVYEPRLQRAAALSEASAVYEWERILERPDIDAVVIATPDHWHAPMAIAAMHAGKDVYCERPMARTITEAKAFRDAAAATGRCVQIGVQESSEGQWHAAHEIVSTGAIGKVVWSQASGGRGQGPAEPPTAWTNGVMRGMLDWNRWLGAAPRRAFDAQRFHAWRNYWDYSGGIATDVFYAKLAALLIAIGPEFPERVSAAGGVYARDGREAPDSFVMSAEYAGGHTIVLASSRAHAQGLPAVIRGTSATLYFDMEGRAPSRPPVGGKVSIASDGRAPRNLDNASHTAPLAARDHMGDWLDAIRARKPCVCNPELGYRAMTAIGMAVDAYRGSQTLYWDAARQCVIPSPPRVLLA